LRRISGRKEKHVAEKCSCTMSFNISAHQIMLSGGYITKCVTDGRCNRSGVRAKERWIRNKWRSEGRRKQGTKKKILEQFNLLTGQGKS